MKVLVLWSHHSGYLHACLQELACRANVVSVFFEPSLEAPFSSDYFHGSKYEIIWIKPKCSNSLNSAFERLLGRGFDIALFSGWHHDFYMHRVARLINIGCVRVLCFDWQWKPSIRNYLKSLYGLLYRSRLFDACFVSGERQYQYALRIGFPSYAIFQGLYSADTYNIVKAPWDRRSKKITFVGRLVESKGCVELATAWRILQHEYTAATEWTLDVCGVGPCEPLFVNLLNCNLHGFLQPDEIALKLSLSKILCAPSIVEPWGLQIHEGAAAGLAIIATDECGSAVHLVRSGYNGIVIRPSSSDAIVSAVMRLLDLDSLDHKNLLEQYGTRSEMLSRQFSPALWADTVECILSSVRSRNPLVRSI